MSGHVDPSSGKWISLPDAPLGERAAITCDNFSRASDAQLIAAAREVLAPHVSKLRSKFRRLLRTKKPDVMIAGPFLWAHLCKWKRGGLATAEQSGRNRS